MTPEERKAIVLKQLTQLKYIVEKQAATEGEIANAAALMAKLMAKHDLTELDIATREDTISVEKGMIVRQFDFVRRHNWRYDLLCVVAEAYGCKAYRGIKLNYYKVIGQEVNTIVAEEMFQYLEAAIDRICAVAWKAYGKEDARDAGVGKLRWVNGFCHGAMVIVAKRLREWLYEQRRDPNYRALMVIRDADLVAAEKRLLSGKPSNIKQSRAGTGDAGAYAHGVREGEKIALQHHITAGNA